MPLKAPHLGVFSIWPTRVGIGSRCFGAGRVLRTPLNLSPSPTSPYLVRVSPTRQRIPVPTVAAIVVVFFSTLFAIWSARTVPLWCTFSTTRSWPAPLVF